MKLRVTEIFFSLQGETKTVGLPTVFIRLTGCPLRCQYCDTSYAFQGGQWLRIEAILSQVAEYNTRYVTVTGGEPLAQPDCLPLLTELCNRGYAVSLETSGAIGIAEVDPRVMTVMDLKTPGSKEAHKNKWENIQHLSADDQVKFVICDERDYNWAKQQLIDHELDHRCEVLFSPCAPDLEPRRLADWIVRDQLPVRFQTQLHKVLWGDCPGV